jgi:hypothetical protein
MPKIIITVNGAEQTLSNNLGKSITLGKGFKYTYQKQLLSRLRVAIASTKDLSEDEAKVNISNILIVERNIAYYAAEQYAELGQDEIHNSFTEIAEEIEELFK